MKIEGLIMESVTNFNQIIPKLISDFPQMPGVQRQRPACKTARVVVSEFNKSCFGSSVIELLNFLLFQIIFVRRALKARHGF